MARIDVDDYFTDDKGNHYHIHMTDHTQGPRNEVLNRLCTFIFDTTIKKEKRWWFPFRDNFVYWVPSESPLFALLDEESQGKSPLNYLMFKRNGNQITITHFGPFGVKMGKYLREIWNERKKKKEMAKEKEKERECLEEERKNIDTDFPTTGTSANRPQPCNSYYPMRTLRDEALNKLFREMILTVGLLATRKAALDTAVETGKAIAKSITKETSKKKIQSGVTKVPLLGLATGLAFVVWRVAQRDFSGACLQLASGTASLVPGVGTAASIGIDAVLLGKDVYENVKKAKEEIEKLKAPYEAALRELKAQKNAMISLLEEEIKECKEAEDACNHCVKGCDQLIKMAMDELEQEMEPNDNDD